MRFIRLHVKRVMDQDQLMALIVVCIVSGCGIGCCIYGLVKVVGKRYRPVALSDQDSIP